MASSQPTNSLPSYPHHFSMEATMADSVITERQRFWRDHVLTAAASDGAIVEYAIAGVVTNAVEVWKPVYSSEINSDEYGTEHSILAETGIGLEHSIKHAEEVIRSNSTAVYRRC